LNILKAKKVVKFVFQIGILLGMLGCAPAGNEAGSTQAKPELSPTPATAAAAPTSSPASPTTTVTTPAEPAEPTATPLPAQTPTEPPAAGSPTAAIPTEIAALVTALPSPAVGPPEQANAADPVAQGLQIYRQQYCGICHRLDAAGTAGVFGPEQNSIGLVAEQRLQDENYQGEATTAAEYIRESILNPGVYLAEGYEQSRHQMPPFTHLSQADVDALVALLLQQRQEVN
jgi:mono/diheme cytochrome c family protein